MSNFVTDNTSLPTNKVDLFTGPSSSRYCSASDYNSVAQACLDLRGQGGWSAITTGTGDTHEYLDVTLGTAFSAATGASGYMVNVEISLTTSTDPFITWIIVNKTTTGFRINFSGSFDGEVRWRAF